MRAFWVAFIATLVSLANPLSASANEQKTLVTDREHCVRFEGTACWWKAQKEFSDVRWARIEATRLQKICGEGAEYYCVRFDYGVDRCTIFVNDANTTPLYWPQYLCAGWVNDLLVTEFGIEHPQESESESESDSNQESKPTQNPRLPR